MSGVSTLQLRKAMLDRVFRGVALPWTQGDVALTRRVPTTNSTPGQLDEPPTGRAYARARFTWGSSWWVAANDNEVANASALYFPSATMAWGTLHGWAILSVEATPKVLAVGTLNEPLRVIAGVRPYLGVGSVSFGMYDG